MQDNIFFDSKGNRRVLDDAYWLALQSRIQKQGRTALSPDELDYYDELLSLKITLYMMETTEPDNDNKP